MQYTVHFFKADANGSFVARAYTQAALQRLPFDKHSGVCIRDTKLNNVQLPQWANRPDSRLSVFTTYNFFFFGGIPPVQQIGNCYMLLNDIGNLRSKANSTSDGDWHLIVEAVKNKGVCFFDSIMSYPRWVKYDGTIEVGGMFYYERFLDETGIMGKQGIHVATVEEREAAFIDALVGKNGIARAEDYEKRNRAARGCIDDLVEGFHSLIHELGQKARCTSSAMKLKTKIEALVELLGSCGINDFRTLDQACNEAEDALADFCTALAAKEDEDAKTPQEVILSGEQAEQLKTAATKSAAAASNSESAKRLIEAHCLPRKSDYQVSQPNLSQWLEEKNVATTVRQIQRWEQYLKTDGTKGTKPPDGYTLQTRLTPQFAQAWVDHYATQERGKLSTRNYFDERTASRDRKPAKPTHGKAT